MLSVKGRILQAVAQVEDVQTLWVQYKSEPDRQLRDRLILTYAPLVKYVAGRLGASLPAHVDESDLVSYGLLGLIDAIERYDLNRDVKFETYAIARIRGAIIDELRSLDWVPRSVRSRAREIERAIAQLEAQLMRPPTDEEIAGKMGVTEEELDDALLEISRSSIGALDELWSSPTGSGDAVSLVDTLEDPNSVEPGGEIEATEVKEMIGEAIAALPEREKLVITLYYYEELTLREIGEVLGVTESRVSQLHTKAILRLKARLAAAQSRAAFGLSAGATPGRAASRRVRHRSSTRVTLPRPVGTEGRNVRPCLRTIRARSVTSLSSAIVERGRRRSSRRCSSSPEPRTASARSSRDRRWPTGTRTSTSDRCRSPRRSAISSGRARRSTWSIRRATPGSRPTPSRRCVSSRERSSS